MTSYVTPKKNSAFIIYVGLPSQASSGTFQSSPTLASGDFKVSIDGAALANLATLPTNTPSGKMVKISLSSSEMNGDNITVVCSDAAGAEWGDVILNIQTSARQVDDLAYPATSGRSMVVDASGLVDANMVKAGPTGSGTAITARDIGASVLLSAGTGTGQLDFTAGVVKANLAQILGTALTETAGQIAAGFKKLFDVASPVFTLLSVNQTGDSYARLGAPVGASHSADVAAVKALLPTALVGGRMDSSVGAMAANVITATAINADAITDAKVAADVTIASVTGAVGSVTGNVGGNVVGSVGSVTGLTASNLDATVSSRLASASYTAPPSAATIAQAVWDALTSALTTVGSIGKLLVTNIDATISSRASAANLATAQTGIDDIPTNAELATALGTADDATLAAIAAEAVKTAAIKVKTDSLAFTVAGQVDANIQYVNDVQVNGNGQTGTEWGP